jgi:N-formylglutamate amidohydrolase
VENPSTLLAVPLGFRTRLLQVPSTPVVLSVPHAGLGAGPLGAPLDPGLDVRCDADFAVDQLYGIHDGAPLSIQPEVPWVAATLSRFVCDLNRHPDDVSAEVVPEHPQPRNEDGRGFLWKVTTAGTKALIRPLSLGEWEARRAIHDAYHGAIAEALKRAKARFGFAVLVDGHSMPSVGRAGHRDPGKERADVVPGDRDGTSCAPSLSRLVGEHFRTRGYQVAFNDPYKGGFITTFHGRPKDDVHAIQIELRRDLYMDEKTFALRPEGFTRLAADLRALLTQLATFKP